MFGDSRALFIDSNAIFPSNFCGKGQEQEQEEEDLFSRTKMNFDMNSLDFSSESFKGLDDDDGNDKGMSNGLGLGSQLLPQFPRQSSTCHVGGLDNNSGLFRTGSSMGMDNQVKVSSGLMRQNSSPAGFFSHITPQSGYGGIGGGVGNYRVANGSNGDLGPTASRLKSQTSLSSGIPSSLGMLSRISEFDGGNRAPSGNENAKSGSINGETQYYASEYPLSSWNDSLHFTENYTGLKRELDADDDGLFSSSQNGEIPNRPSILSHHLSLPKTSSEISCMDKLLQLQDSVPCKIRAKRGCATHPRSIAERVRRTRISERMRKLQELVPHMDKQTNTADMLDLAVEYIKNLQKQYKTLNDSRANCKCSAMQKQGLN